MADIKTDHNGHEIVYSENQDVWRCWKLDLEAKTLSALRNKINKIDADARRINIEVIRVGSYHQPTSDRVNCTMIDADGESAWVIETKTHKVYGVTKTETTRRKVDLRSLAECSPENEALIAEWTRLFREQRDAEARAKAAAEAIPRLTASRLQELGAALMQKDPAP